MAKRKAASSASGPKKVQKRESQPIDYSEFYSSVLEDVLKLTDEEDERLLADPFIKLPSKKLYPDYYTIVKNPITIGEIQRKVSRGKYSSSDTEEFEADFSQLYDNAALYNDPESWLVTDALEILNFVKKEAENFTLEAGKDHEIEDQQELTFDNLPINCENILVDTRDHEFKNLGIISGPFLEVVDRKKFPDYFKVIEEPTSINKVLSNLSKKYYFSPKKSLDDNLQHFYEDVSLIWSNAQSYNDKDSLIYQDSVKLQEYFEEKFTKLKSRLPKNPPKLKIKLGRPRKQVLKEESEELDLSDRKSVKNAENDDEDNEGDDQERGDKDVADEEGQETDDSDLVTDDEDMVISKDTPVLEKEYNVLGKTSDQPLKEKAFIQQFTLSSSSDILSQIQNYQPIPESLGNLSPDKQLKYTLFPTHNVVPTTTIYEYKFPSTGHDSVSYAISLPPNSLQLATFKLSLHSIFCQLKKADIFSRGVVTSDDDFQCKLHVNDEEITAGGQIYEDMAPSGINLLNFQYDIKLSKGVNILNFELKIAPALSKKIGKNGMDDQEEDDDDESTSRHTRNQLQQLKMSWDVEKIELIILVS